MAKSPYMRKLSLKELASVIDDLMTDEDRFRVKKLIKKHNKHGKEKTKV
jgi:hypothetical protein